MISIIGIIGRIILHYILGTNRLTFLNLNRWSSSTTIVSWGPTRKGWKKVFVAGGTKTGRRNREAEYTSGGVEGVEGEGVATEVWDGKKAIQMRFDLAKGQDPARHESKTDQDRHFFLECRLKLSRLEEMRRAATSATDPATGKAKADPGGMRRVGAGVGRIISVAGVTKMGTGGTPTKGVGGTPTKGVGGTLAR